MNCLGIRLNREDPRNIAVKKINGIKWSQSNKCWYGSISDAFYSSLKEIFGNELIPGKQEKDDAIIFNNDRDELPAACDLSERADKNSRGIAFTKENDEKLKKFGDWLASRRYSKNTIKTYLDAAKTFLRFFFDKKAELISNDDIIKFNVDYILKNDYSASFQNQVVNAVKLFFQVNENIVIDLSGIHRPKRSHPLPNVLSKEEIKILLSSNINLKHQCMLSLAYSCGLRVGELLSLVLADIDSKRMIVRIRNSKGNKDRIVPLSPKILVLLRDYYTRYKPAIYLFEGEKAGNPYSMRSIQLVIKQAAKKAGIEKPLTMHWLRHSFATHLHESGTDIRYIQELLGHSSTKTTQIYTHISTRSIQNIRSPFDSL